MVDPITAGLVGAGAGLIFGRNRKKNREAEEELERQRANTALQQNTQQAALQQTQQQLAETQRQLAQAQLAALQPFSQQQLPRGDISAPTNVYVYNEGSTYNDNGYRSGGYIAGEYHDDDEAPQLIENSSNRTKACDNCDAAFLARHAHYNCGICYDGDYDLCQICKDRGYQCPGRHTLHKLRLA